MVACIVRYHGVEKLISNEEYQNMAKRSPAELRAIAFQLADEIETRAQPLIAAGLRRDRAIALAVAQASGHLIIARG